MALQLSSKLGFIAWFTINQTEIIEQCCVNKNKPELNCKAKCYLSSKLVENNESAANTPAPTKLKQATEEVLFCESEPEFYAPLLFIQRITTKQVATYFHLYSNSVFQPPRA